MAVSINTVYQRVLAMANKEQRGYLTPQEFNLLANQAQLEIFEQYFYDINQFNRTKGNSTEFSDMLHILEEKISAFRVNEASLTAAGVKFEDTFQEDITDWSELVPANGVVSHDAPSSTNNFNGGLKVLATGASHTAESDTNFSLTAGKQYIVNWDITDMDEPAQYAVIVDDAGSAAVQHIVYEPSIGSFNFIFTADATGNHNVKLQNGDTTNSGKYITFGSISVKEIDNSTLPTDLYRLGEVFYKEATDTYHKTVAEVNSNEVTKFNQSPLARPTTKNPVYVRSGIDSITIYPTTLATSSTVTCNYIKKPAEVSWGYNVVLNKAVYNASSTTDFEFHESEEPTLVNKILLLAGIVIEKPQLSGIAGTMVNEEKQQEKS